MVFTGLRNSGRLDLEAVEMATRAAMHRAGAAALEQLLQWLGCEEGEVAFECGKTARYHEMSPKRILAALGPAHAQRPYYFCSHCHRG